jgi:CRISPR-associated endonuclease/helicase Cas3
LCLLPVLADSAVIIDEVHSFDPRMFKNLVAFLQVSGCKFYELA